MNKLKQWGGEGAESPEEMEDEITMQEPEPNTEQSFFKN